MKSTGNETVEKLVLAIFDALEENVNLSTSPGEAFSAILVVLHRLLVAMRRYESPMDHIHNTHEILRVLAELMHEHGTVLH